ncbi:hypothetical protein [Evansella cellulosilytica]|uniref:DUF4401 domain-containing protein n=1 Tax=Evansella cellulosilytica (strain ATCC 21833 / DSM 2522 / FERM P-1141 / JCM 9156 / N-4) TaxID=649639 RepID=E6TW57_EVAC2|nr:hypothetical protein [Evansella cellulosilytica]ADU29880.1 hypothetical protein Bcell_1617 [Evansella cellulosilytica DSM 2522]
MDSKKKIIIKEIYYWKENNLLPEIYCNFLLRLYSEGEEIEKHDANQMIQYFKAMLMILLALLLIALSFVVIYFTQFSPSMQILIMVGITGTLFFVCYKLLKRDLLLAHIYVMVTAFMSFITVLHMHSLYFDNNHLYLGVFIFILCLTWVYIGYRFKLQYLCIAGGVGIVLFFIFQFM